MTEADVPPARDDAWAWETYWRTGRLASCIEHPGGGYGGEIAAAWRDFFARLSDGARILDVGTGNGAIPLLAIEAADAGAKTFSIDAIDAAAIAPQLHVRGRAQSLSRVRFHPNTPMSAPPFAPASFDAITGQYALEYSDIAASVTALAPLLGVGGRVQFILHAAEGEPVAGASEEVVDARYLLEEVRLFELAEHALDASQALVHKPPGPGEAQRLAALTAALQDAIQEVRARPLKRAARSPMLENAARVVEHTFEARSQVEPALALGKVREIQGAVEAHLLRSRALVRAACTRAQAESVAKIFRSHGLSMAGVDALSTADQKLLGWKLVSL
jgi:SAM-dependent methyltransferase